MGDSQLSAHVGWRARRSMALDPRRALRGMVEDSHRHLIRITLSPGLKDADGPVSEVAGWLDQLTDDSIILESDWHIPLELVRGVEEI